MSSSMLVAVLMFCLLPAVAFAGAAIAAPRAFVFSSSGMSGVSRVGVAVGVLLIVPAFLWLLAAGAGAAHVWGTALSAVAAAYGAQRLGGWPATAVVSGAAVAVTLLAAASSVAVGVLSACAGIGGGLLLAGVLRGRSGWLFAGAFIGLDVIVVGGGLVEGAVAQLASFQLSEPQQWPMFNRVSANGLTLGAVDISFAVLLGALAAQSGARRATIALWATVYLAGQAAVVTAGLASGAAIPATLAGAGVIALAAGANCRRRACRSGSVGACD